MSGGVHTEFQAVQLTLQQALPFVPPKTHVEIEGSYIHLALSIAQTTDTNLRSLILRLQYVIRMKNALLVGWVKSRFHGKQPLALVLAVFIS